METESALPKEHLCINTNEVSVINLDQLVSMSSYDFLTKVINPARVEAGEKPVRNNDFVSRIEDELEGQNVTYEIFVRRGIGRKSALSERKTFPTEPITTMVIADHITITSSHSVCVLLPAGLPLRGGLSRSVGCDFRVQTKGVHVNVSTSSHL